MLDSALVLKVKRSYDALVNKPLGDVETKWLVLCSKLQR